MKKQFLQNWNCSRFSLFALPVLSLFAFLFGFILAAVIMATDADSWFPMGSVMALAMIPSSVLLYTRYFNAGFQISIAMGVTRRDYLLYYSLRHVIITVLALIVVFLLALLECTVLPQITSLPAEIPPERIFSCAPLYWGCLAAVPILLIINILGGIAFCKLGIKGYWILYAVYMIFCITISSAEHMTWVTGISAAVWIALAVVFSGGMIAAIAKLYPTVSVK